MLLRKIVTSLLILCLVTPVYAGTDPGFGSRYYSGSASEPFESSNLILQRFDPEIFFDWGTDSPDPSLPSDGFTLKGAGQIISPESGEHIFRTYSDDGVRLYIDNQLIIDNWTDHGPTYDTGSFLMTAGVSYAIRLEFYENGGGAVIQLDWKKPSDTDYVSLDQSYVSNSMSTPNPPTDISLSQSLIADGLSYGAYIGTLLVEDDNVGEEHSYEFAQGLGGEDNSSFSISGDSLIFQDIADYSLKQNYHIRVRVNDGVYTFEKMLVLQVVEQEDYYSGFCAEYYIGTAADPFLEENRITKQVEVAVNSDWGDLSPGEGIPADGFTIRWNGFLKSAESGLHTFRTLSDDGIRLYINDELIINNWTNHSETYNFANYELTAGVYYDVRLEYYEASGGAVAELSWMKPSSSSYSLITDQDISYVQNCSNSDITAPQIFLHTPEDGVLIPKHSFDLTMSFQDDIGGTGVNTSSGESIEIFRFAQGDWGNDISDIVIDMDRRTFASDYAIYPIGGLPYGKYKFVVSIQDMAGNQAQAERIFYVDEPSFQVSGISQGALTLGNLKADTLHYSSTIRLEVETLGAAFKVYLRNSSISQDDGGEIASWDGSYGFAYTDSGSLQGLSGELELWSETHNLNSSGEKNSYTKDIELAALIPEDQLPGLYTGEISFDIVFEY